MPITSHSLFSLAQSGLAGLAVCDAEINEVTRLLRARRAGLLSEGDFLSELDSAIAGHFNATMGFRHTFEMSIMRYTLKRKVNESAARRMRKRRALTRGEDPALSVPTEEEEKKETFLLRMEREAEAAEAGATEAIFEPDE